MLLFLLLLGTVVEKQQEARHTYIKIEEGTPFIKRLTRETRCRNEVLDELWSKLESNLLSTEKFLTDITKFDIRNQKHDKEEIDDLGNFLSQISRTD